MLKTFNIGGVHPEENKLSANAPIEILPYPKTMIIPVAQSLGAPSIPVVEKGAKVKTGQLIAKGEGFIASNIHSPVTGTVTKIDDALDSSGYKRKAIFIDVDAEEWEEGIDTSADLKKEITLSSEEIVNKIKEKGIVGLGGATFPSHVKMMVPQGKKAEVLIINAVECEPYLTSDHRLMLEKADEIMVGVSIIMKALNVTRAIIGIENNKPDAIAHLSKIAANFKGIEVVALKVKYPQGAEKQLIKAAINREVPSGKLPIEVGAVVQNVGTAFAVYEAVQKNKPLIERVVTITGKGLKKPSNLMVRIGTPVTLLIEHAGGMPEKTGKVINGGPMMGKALNSVDVPVVKGTSGIVVVQDEETKREEVYNCIRCGKCVSVCPMGLEPYLLAVVSEQEKLEEAEKDRIMDCMECGSCHYTCPSGRPLLDYLRVGKNKIMRSRKK
ncbi:MAG TPA: electron transport complex subunit RsxC [Bacteroidales bacterium]|nr:MAG: electron transporter RnfC [Bacteroidetes bacterium GWF2_35_48]OFY92899.1 MAG: electron transporter RnfC [Bacteroidetes bacterium RIFOXYC12_FULL_35_7]HBX51555.1 electron transport complex subunit RsxC [Bacteroidales bacterium]